MTKLVLSSNTYIVFFLLLMSTTELYLQVIAIMFVFSVVIMIFSVGIVYFRHDNVKLDKRRFRLIVGSIVTMMWAINVMAEIIIASYTVNFLVHGIMGGIVGWLFSDEGINFNIGGR